MTDFSIYSLEERMARLEGLVKDQESLINNHIVNFEAEIEEIYFAIEDIALVVKELKLVMETLKGVLK